MRMKGSVPHVERLVVDEQADDLAVGHVDQGLTRFRVAIRRLRVWQRHLLVDRVQVGPGDRMRLALVEVGTPADVAVGQREDGLRLPEPLEVEL